MAFRQLQVPELKRYLRERGIQSSSYRKEALVRLAEAAHDLRFEEEEPDTVDDHKHSLEDRRTVIVGGSTHVLPDVFSIREWSNDLNLMPTVEIGDIMVYLLNRCDWSADRLKSYKADNGYQLYMCNHITDVQLHPVQGFYYVKACCIPETRQSERPYSTWVLLDKIGAIQSGGCTCVADDGGCKHCVALLFSVQNFCERHADRNTEAGTDVACKWDKPRQKSEAFKLDHIQYGNQEQNRELYKPNITGMEQRGLEKDMYKLCKGTNALFLQCVEPPSDESDTSEDSEQELQTFTNMILMAKNDKLDTGSILNILKARHSNEYIGKLEEITRGQVDNPSWKQHRRGRITASLAHSVLHCNMDKLKSENYIVKNITGNSIPFSTEATKYGQDMEKVALNLYVLNVRHLHKKFSHRDCGLFVSRQFPYLAASPDQIIDCLCCGKGVVEIKCTYTHKDQTPLDVAKCGNYFIHLQDGKIKLKKNTSWYTQIQTQLGVCDLHYCDFVFFTLKGIIIDRIPFDTQYFKELQCKADQFFHKFLI